MADSKNKKELADFLISLEKAIVKKIPYLIEVQQYDKALHFAVDSGDPNIINKVILKILQNRHISEAFQLIHSVPDGLRHLRNYAKSRDDERLLGELNQFIIGGGTGLKPNSAISDTTELNMMVRKAY